TFVLKPGFPFNAAGVRGQVLEIGRDFVVWRSGEDLWRLILGENLKARVKQPRAVAVTPASPGAPVGTTSAVSDEHPLVAPKVPAALSPSPDGTSEAPLAAPKP